MTHVEPQVLTRNLVEELAVLGGPCASIYLPPFRPADPSTPMPKVALRAAAQAVAQRFRQQQSMRGMEVEALIQPIIDLSAQAEFELGHTDGWAVFRNQEAFYYVRVPNAHWGEKIWTGNAFHVLPLLEALGHYQSCTLLAVTHKGVRMYHLDGAVLTPVPLPAGVPAAFDEDRMRNAAEHAANRSAGVHFGVADTADRSGRAYLAYFKEVARGLEPRFEADHRPVLLAGAHEVVAAFREACDEKWLMPTELTLSPDGGYRESELAERAAALLADLPLPAEERAAARARSLGPAKRRTEAQSAMNAATGGRVSALFVSRTEEEDLNGVALEVLRHGGDVWVVPPDRMPFSGRLIAELRY